MMEGFIMVILKNSLRECREAAHINQKELAAQIGIARETLGKLERGDNQNPVTGLYMKWLHILASR